MVCGQGEDRPLVAIERFDQRRELIKQFYGDFYTWVNALSFLIQAFLVSRVLDRIGVRRAHGPLPP